MTSCSVRMHDPFAGSSIDRFCIKAQALVDFFEIAVGNGLMDTTFGSMDARFVPAVSLCTFGGDLNTLDCGFNISQAIFTSVDKTFTAVFYQNGGLYTSKHTLITADTADQAVDTVSAAIGVFG